MIQHTKKYITAIAIAGLICGFLHSNTYAQQQQATTAPKDFLDNEAILTNMENGANAIIKTGGFLSPADARIQLEQNSNKKVKIAKISPNQTHMNSEAIAHRLRQSALIVGDAYLCGSCDHTHINPASGYVIDASGIFVTNYHVMEGYSKGQLNGQQKLSMQAMTADGKVYPVKAILSASKERDLAIVQLEVGKDKLVPLALGDDAAVGAEVFVMSNPNTMFYYFSKGVVARNYMRPVDKTNDQSYPETEITADYAAGSSGAAVVDSKCNVISTVSTTRSVYYRATSYADLQMVVKGTKPVCSLRTLISH